MGLNMNRVSSIPWDSKPSEKGHSDSQVEILSLMTIELISSFAG